MCADIIHLFLRPRHTARVWEGTFPMTHLLLPFPLGASGPLFLKDAVSRGKGGCRTANAKKDLLQEHCGDRVCYVAWTHRNAAQICDKKYRIICREMNTLHF